MWIDLQKEILEDFSSYFHPLDLIDKNLICSKPYKKLRFIAPKERQPKEKTIEMAVCKCCGIRFQMKRPDRPTKHCSLKCSNKTKWKNK